MANKNTSVFWLGRQIGREYVPFIFELEKKDDNLWYWCFRSHHPWWVCNSDREDTRVIPVGPFTSVSAGWAYMAERVPEDAEEWDGDRVSLNLTPWFRFKSESENPSEKYRKSRAEAISNWLSFCNRTPERKLTYVWKSS